MLVEQFMTKDVVVCSEDMTVEEASKLMIAGNFSVLPVIGSNQKLVGIITESDFIGKEIDVPHALASIKQLFGQNFYFKEVEPIYQAAKTKKLKEIMSTGVKSVSPTTSLTDLVNFMIKNHLKRVPVIESGILVGIITRRDLVRAFAQI
ncbi:MAG: CBS domain-containing protein [Oligoflexia bacterium]|nr:CBS domain-containing protein [Oligoflexia bacterium]